MNGISQGEVLITQGSPLRARHIQSKKPGKTIKV